MDISVIIPTLNEEKTIEQALVQLQRRPGLEIIVADGGSSDRTIEKTRKKHTRLIHSPPGRGSQQNRGAAASSGDILLFLHCDTCLPQDFPEHIEHCLKAPETVAGAFQLAIGATGLKYRLLEKGAALRSSWLRLIYGDQAIFVRREIFFRAGGFPEQTLFEDIALIRRLRHFGRIAIVKSRVTTSPRRWQQLGICKTTLINQLMLAGYLAGLDQERLARLYYRAIPEKNRPASEKF